MLRITLLGAGIAALAVPAPAADITPIEQIVVTASPIAGGADRFATIVEAVEREAVLREGGASLGDALAGVPGVAATGFATGASRPVIRGFDANRVRILENGVGSFDVSEVGPDHGVPVDPLAAQRIEVVRGAATLRYGSQAIGGVVNAINNRVPLQLPDADFAGEASASYGINASAREGSLLADARMGDFALHADGFVRRTEDYDTPRGVLPNSFFDGTGYSFGTSHFFGAESRIGAGLVRYDAEYGIPNEDAFIDMRQTKALFGASLGIGEGAWREVNIDAGFADYTHDEVDPGAGPVSTFKDEEWDARGEAVIDGFGLFSAAAIGVQLQHRDFSALGEGADYLLPTETRSVAGFAFVEAPLGERFEFQAGARLEHVRVSGTPVSGVAAETEFTPASVSAGVLFDASDGVKLGLTFSSAARAPAQTELFAIGPHEATSTYEIGDPALAIERANSIEATLRLRFKGFELDGAVWSAWFDDYIYGALTGRNCDENGNCVAGGGEELAELLYLQQGAHFRGLEAKVRWELGALADGALAAEFLADYVRATLADGTNVPRIPAWRAGAGLAWECAAFDFGLRAVFTGRQDDVAAHEMPTKGFLGIDAYAAWRPFGGEAFEVMVTGRNLTDAVQRNAVSLNKDEVMRPGRDLRLVARWKV